MGAEIGVDNGQGSEEPWLFGLVWFGLVWFGVLGLNASPTARVIY